MENILNMHYYAPTNGVSKKRCLPREVKLQNEIEKLFDEKLILVKSMVFEWIFCIS